MNGLHKHHIVFRSQGGLDFELNYKHLTYEEHEGAAGPHQNRAVDLCYKIELQKKLEKLFPKGPYNIKEIAERLGRSEKYWKTHFRKVSPIGGPYQKKEIIRKLMGGKLYG